MSLEQTNGVYQISGDLTIEKATEVFNSLGFSGIDQQQLTIDFSQVKESDSATLAVMLEWENQAKLNQKQISFANVPSQLMRLIKMADLQTILKLA